MCNKKLILIISISILSVAGCSTYKKISSYSQCSGLDWFSQGMEDGENGASFSNFDTRVESCIFHEKTPNIADYAAGYHQGLEKFCSESSGFQKGMNSNFIYTGICPDKLAKNFIKGMNEAHQIAELQGQADKSKSELSLLGKKEQALNVELELTERRLAAQPEGVQKIKYQKKLRKLNQQLDDVKDKKELHNRNIAKYKQELSRLNDELTTSS